MKEIKKLKGPMNPKLARKIARYLVEDKFTYEQYHEQSEEFKKIHNSFVEFLALDMNIVTINSVLKVLEIEIEKNMIELALASVKNIKEVMELFELFVESYKESRFGEQTLLVFKLIMNHWLFKNGYSLLIIYPSFTKELANLVKYGGDIAVMKRLVTSFYIESYVRNTIVKVRSQEEIIIEIKKIKDVLVLQYGINKLEIFGSYAKGTQNEFSDLDLLIETKDDLNEFEIYAMNDYLSVILELKVNIAVQSDFVHDEMVKVF